MTDVTTSDACSSLTLYAHNKTVQQRTTIQQNGDWYTGRWWVGCYIWYSEEGPGRAAALPCPVPSLLYQMQQPTHQRGQCTNFVYSTGHNNCVWALKGYSHPVSQWLQRHLWRQRRRLLPCLIQVVLYTRARKYTLEVFPPGDHPPSRIWSGV